MGATASNDPAAYAGDMLAVSTGCSRQPASHVPTHNIVRGTSTAKPTTEIGNHPTGAFGTRTWRRAITA